MDVQHVIHVTDQVVDADHAKVGEVSAVSPTYLHITSGLLGFGQDYYIPYDGIAEVSPGRVVLRVPVGRIAELGWDRPPADQSAPAPLGHYGTMPAAPVEWAPLAPAPPPETAPETPPADREPVHVEATRVEKIEPPTAPPVVPMSVHAVVGHELRDVRGVSVGKITSVGNGYAQTTSGFFGLGRRFYVPLDQIIRCDGDFCYVDLTRDQMKAAGWSEKPAAE